MKCLPVVHTLLALWPALAFAETPNDYAYGAPIATSTATPFQRIALPASVYGVLSGGDLRDLRVFNGAGEVVPHALEPRPGSQLASAAAIEVPLFALPRTNERDADGVEVRVERRGDGTIVSVHEAGRTAQTPAAWLLDASRLKRSVRALELRPSDMQAQFAGRMRVEASDDLEHWRVLAAAAPLLVAQSGAQNLSRLRIEWPATEAKYWRLSWADGAAPAQAVGFAGARLEPAQTTREPARAWMRIEPLRMRLEPGEYAYELPAGAPVDRLRIHLPQVNSVVPVALLTRAASERDWRPIGNHTVYRLERDGAEFENPDLAAGPARELLLRFDTRGGGPGGMPSLEIGWAPHTLVFAARGDAPFVLAYGNAGAMPAAYPVAALVPGYGGEESARLIGDATLGTPARAGGEQRLRAQVDLKRWILWSVLGAAVLLLGLMAYRLWRQVGGGAPR